MLKQGRRAGRATVSGVWRLSALLAAQLVLFHCPAARGVLRQAATACDRAKHSVNGCGGVFGENTRFSMYIEISESRGISACYTLDPRNRL